MKHLFSLLAVALLAVTSFASNPFASPYRLVEPRLPATLEVEETVTIDEQETGVAVLFDEFDPANGTLSSIQVGLRVERQWIREMENTSSTANYYVIGDGSPTGTYPWGYDLDDNGSLAGANYQKITMRRENEFNFSRTNYAPIFIGKYLADDTVTVDYYDADPDFGWSGTITDPTALSNFTGTGTVRIYFDSYYNNDYTDGGGSLSASGDYVLNVVARVRYNY